MKKVFLMLSVCLIFFSCKKEEEDSQPVINKKLFPVSFNLSGFKVQTGAISKLASKASASNDLSESVNYIYYSVWDEYGSGGQLIKSINQTSADPDFGTIRDSLPEGSYFVAVFASKRPINATPDESGSLGTQRVLMDLPATDVFYANATIAVGGEVAESLTLSRIVGKLVIQIEDVIPLDARDLHISTYRWANSVTFSSGRSDGFSWANSYTYTFKQAEKGKAGVKIYMWPLGSSFSDFYTISVRNNAGATIATKDVSEILIERNKRTLLKGELFTAGSGGIDIDVDKDWDEGYEYPF
jgi:hypothetical protein